MKKPVPWAVTGWAPLRQCMVMNATAFRICRSAGSVGAVGVFCCRGIGGLFWAQTRAGAKARVRVRRENTARGACISALLTVEERARVQGLQKMRQPMLLDFRRFFLSKGYYPAGGEYKANIFTACGKLTSC